MDKCIVVCFHSEITDSSKNKRTKHTTMDEFQFSRSVVSDSLQPHESKHARPPCPSPTKYQLV